jgi:superfamily II DNA or RNA helicase
MKIPQFVLEVHKKPSLCRGKEVKEILFSRGTYQVAIYEKKGRKTFWPFLHLDDQGNLLDFFCTCPESEKKLGCVHVALAFDAIFDEKSGPLHERFKRSFWNILFQIAQRRCEMASSLKKKKTLFFCSKVKESSFHLETKTKGAEKHLKALTAQTAKTESSWKFSNFSTEEVALWKEGKAPLEILFELSFWSDLAKWFFSLQEEKKKYEVYFTGKFPHELRLSFSDVSIFLSLKEEDWLLLIPTLSSIESPLKLHGSEEGIKEISFDPIDPSFHVRFKEEGRKEGAKIEVGEWIYVEKDGFYPKEMPIRQERIEKEKIASFLEKYPLIFQKCLKKTSIDLHPHSAHYHLFFDEFLSLHIELYLFDPHELQQPEAFFSPPWIYLPMRGFFRLKELYFSEKETLISKENIEAFVTTNRIWLQEQVGFQTYLTPLSSHLIYELNSKGDLRFDLKMDLIEEKELLDFDDWVYVKGRGFYLKKTSTLSIQSGMVVKKAEIGTFIAEHKEDLEEVAHFFTSFNPIEKIGLEVFLNEQEELTIHPKIQLALGVSLEELTFFDQYVYILGRGFFELLQKDRLPAKYTKSITIPHAEESFFFSFEWDALEPFLIRIDPRLKKPEKFFLKVVHLTQEKRKKRLAYLAELSYESELGHLGILELWKALQSDRKYYFSKAGLLSLKQPRFHWLHAVKKERFDSKSGYLKLSTMEWLRLCIFENIEEPTGETGEDKKTRALLEELWNFRSDIELNISLLSAKLRPYQETGLHWLWFLYTHGLSGILCDEMGLGKTHQAMALIAAACQEGEKKKFLVVCPTSVIYHWQELLKKFLPSLKVMTYHGLYRSLEGFEENKDLLLSSYGIVRSDRKELKKIFFEIAIFDEVQIAKNYLSKTFHSLRSLSVNMKLGLTGTPIENRIRELKTLLDLVLPSYLPGETAFQEFFIHPIEKENDEEKKQLLQKLVRPFLLRRKKAEVLLDLPEKTEEISYCDLSEEQKKLYRNAVVSSHRELMHELQDSKKNISYIHVFALLTRLKQICNHPSLIYKDLKNFSKHESGKWDLFVELLSEARESNQKVVVFSQYLDMIAIIEEYLKKENIGFASIKGSTRDRASEMKRFREDPACEVFVASLLAAGLGIDLSAGSVVIHYDRWWNPAKENQATDRVHRLGQNRGVQVFKLVSKQSIEEHIHRLIEKKKGLIEEIVGKDESDIIKCFSRDDLLQLLQEMQEDIYL